ncbi:LysR family transcriptional regulator [Vogesella alkaliphila]|uniref:LysR family transcriptional regulator n=1 Tax=Vogesella alkaliphila TaxID=1193621 RepID=A0ABQ2YMA1_9NEIS|nr:LysR family transcriptional regulator [Vogesella alkaliphila]GGX86667.1 LysR family transcriptional regulator [Vogesella alkaliphila]
MIPPLAELFAFACVARHRSFRAAALELGVTPSALSHSLRQLEARLQLRLLHRTTRSVTATEAGEALLAQLTPALSQIDGALESVNDYRAQPQGQLRLNVPRTAAYLLLMPLLPAFLQRYPHISLDLVCDDKLVDIVGGGFDAGMRFGETLAADMVAVRVGPPMRFAVIANPGYLAQHGTPQHPAELAQHNCIRQRFGNGALYAWELAKDGEALQIQPDGQLILGEQPLMVEAAAAGLGIALVFEGYAAKALAEGRVIRLLDDWCPPMPGLHLYYPSGRHLPLAMRLWIDHLRAALAARDDA